MMFNELRVCMENVFGGTGCASTATKVTFSLFTLYLGRVAYFWLIARHRHARLNQAIHKRRLQRTQNIENVNRALTQTETSIRESILALDLPSLVHALHMAEFTPVQVLHAYQQAAITAHERTNCLCELLEGAEEEAMALAARHKEDRADLPLFGVPFSLKESIKMKGCASTLGYAQHLDRMETVDAQTVITLRQLGAIPFARTNMPQSLLNYACSNPIFGTTCSPLVKTRSAGGSSGGEAALIACKGSLFGIGGDVGGSVRIPAHFSGVVGFKPSKSRVSQLGSLSSVPGRPMTCASVGPLAADVRTAALITQYLVQSPSARATDPYMNPLPWTPVRQDRKLTIGYFETDGWFEPVPACVRAVKMTIDKLRTTKHNLVKWTPPDTALNLGLFVASGTVDGGKYVLSLVNKDIPEPTHSQAYAMFAVPQWLRALFLYVAPARMYDMFRYLPQTSSDLRQAYAMIDQYRQQYVAHWLHSGLDVLVCPAFPSVAMPHDLPQKVLSCVSHTAVYNTLDLPCGVLPCTQVSQQDIDQCKQHYPTVPTDYWYNLIKQANIGREVLGLPVGVQVVSLPHQEELCLHAMQLIHNLLQQS